MFFRVILGASKIFTNQSEDETRKSDNSEVSRESNGDLATTSLQYFRNDTGISDKNLLLSLPAELILLILSFLDKKSQLSVSETCRRLYGIPYQNITSFDPRRIYFSRDRCFLRKESSDEVQQCIKHTAKLPALETLNFSNCSLSDELFQQIIDKNPTLKTLLIGHTRFMNYNVKVDFSHLSRLPHLEVLDVQSCSLPGGELEEIVQNCPKLKELNISGNKHINGFIFSQPLENLEILNAHNCALTNKNLENIQDHCPKLKQLKISDNTQITDFMPSQSFGNLEILEMHNCALTNEGLGNILRKCLKLQKLNTSNNIRITDFIFSQPLEDLEVLDVSNDSLTNGGLENILRNCLKLRQLNISNNEQITDFIFSQFLEDLEVLDVAFCSLTDAAVQNIFMFCPKLRELRIGVDSINPICSQPRPKLETLTIMKPLNLDDNLTREQLQNIFQNCLNLKQLGLHVSIEIEDFILSQPHRQLEVLDLSRSTLTHKGMRNIIKYCPNLKKLMLARNIIENSTIFGIKRDKIQIKSFSGLKNLEVLDLSCAHLTNEELGKILKNHPKLKELDICNSKQITEFIFSQPLPELEILNVDGCNLTYAALQKILKNCPKLKELHICENKQITDDMLDQLPKNIRYYI